MISIILTTYNRKKTLKRAIQSVLSQSYTNFELIIVDDCSTDGTDEVIKKFKDDRIKYIKIKENSGHDGYPKNLGIKNAQGDYICFLDDDDAYRPEALKILSTYITHTKADMVYGDYMNHQDRKKRPGWSVDFDIMTLMMMNYIAMPVVMVRKEKILEIGGFNENIPKFKDWNLWLRLQKNGCSIMHIPIIVADVYYDNDTLSCKHQHKIDADGRYYPILIENGKERELFNVADCNIYADKTCLGKKKKLKVAIFTLTLDRAGYTERMYNSMVKTAGYEFDWFVIDQGSKDKTRDFLQGKAKTRFKKDNIGIAKGWTEAVEWIKSEGDYHIIIKADNDTEFITHNWLKDMVELFEKNKKIILSPYVEGLEGSPGGVLRQRMNSDMPYVQINDRVLGLAPNLGGIVFASYVDLYQGFKFPEQIPGNKDYYLSMYARSVGYNLFYMEEYRVKHIRGSSGQREDYPGYFKKVYGET